MSNGKDGHGIKRIGERMKQWNGADLQKWEDLQ